MRSKTSKFVVLNFILLTILLPFQNCSNKINSELVSQSLNSSLSTIEAEPEIAFIEKTSLYNTRNIVSTFEVTGADALTIKSIKCQLGNQAAQDCSSQSVQSNNLTDGDYVLKVSVEMVSGKISELSRNFRIDATIPTLSISQTPASVTNAQVASFTFLSADNLSGIMSTECSVDNAAYALCISPKALNGVTAGAHNIKIRTTDRAGNVSSVYSYNWAVDLSMPTVTLQSTPGSVVSVTSASFSFSGIGITSYECSIDNAAYVACVSPKSYTGLSSAAHNFKVRGQNAQNVQSSAVSYNWTIDTVVPTKPILTSSFQAVGNTKSGNFIFSSTDAGSGIKEHQCSLNGVAFAVCSSPSLVTAAEGSNNFKVRAIDLAGNASVESVITMNMDTVKPVISFTQSPSTTTQTTATFAFNISDPGSGLLSTQCSLDGTAFVNCASPANLSGLSTAAHKYSVQVKDNAGNITTIEHSWIVNAVVQPPPPPASGKVNVFMAIGKVGRTVMSCDDGVTWINDRSDNDSTRCWITGDPNYVECDHDAGSAMGIDSGSDGWVYAQYGWGYNGTVRKSRDGKNWQIVRSNGWGGGLAVTNNVVFSYWEYNGATSKDQGATWQPTTAINPYGTTDHGMVHRVGQKMIVKGRLDGELFVSSDSGTTWKKSLAFKATWGGSFAEGNGVLVAHNDGVSARSTDGGMTWTSQVVASNLRWSSGVLFNGSHFVNWSNGMMWKSTDGVSWSSTAFKIDKFSAAGWDGSIAYNPKTGTYTSVTGGWTQWYAKQFAIRSTDGINWVTLDTNHFKGGHPVGKITVVELDAAACGQ